MIPFDVILPSKSVPFFQQGSIRLATPNKKSRIYVSSVSYCEFLECSLTYDSYESFENDVGFCRLEFSSVNSSTVFEIVHNPFHEYHKEGLGFMCSGEHCRFLQSEVADYIKDRTKLLSANNALTNSNQKPPKRPAQKIQKHEFKLEAFKALDALKIPYTTPRSLLKKISDGEDGTRSKVKAYFLAHPETAYLVRSEHTFNKHWDMLVHGELDKYDQLSKI
jgi:hypothetical protein